jgi:hypothetical protein
MKQNSVEITNQINFLTAHQLHPLDLYSLWKCDIGHGHVSTESALLTPFIYNDGDGTSDYQVIQRLIGSGSLAIYETVNNIIGFEESEYVQAVDLKALCRYLDYTAPLGASDFLVGLLVRSHHSGIATSDRIVELATLDALVRSWSRYNDIYVLDCTYEDYLSQQKTVN